MADYTPDQIKRALLSLGGEELRRFPYAEVPGVSARTRLLTREQWDEYRWNPPQGRDGEPDDTEDVIEKPSWDEVLAAAEAIFRPLAQRGALAALRRQAERKILAAYSAENAMDEVRMRLRGANTPDQDAARDAILAQYRRIKKRVLDTATLADAQALYAQLRSADADALWRTAAE